LRRRSWKIFKALVIEKEKTFYEKGLRKFEVDGDTDVLLSIDGHVDEFVPPANTSLRSIIKQRRQWALRATRRNEGPNVTNQRLLNVRDGIIPALLHLALKDGAVDWEIARNGALALSIASYELQNHHDMINDPVCVKMIVDMCLATDPEVKMYAAVTVANLSHKDESAQVIFGNSDAVPALLKVCDSDDVVSAPESSYGNILPRLYISANAADVLRRRGGFAGGRHVRVGEPHVLLRRQLPPRDGVRRRQGRRPRPRADVLGEPAGFGPERRGAG
jgi:hypothetical protein